MNNNYKSLTNDELTFVVGGADDGKKEKESGPAWFRLVVRSIKKAIEIVSR